MTKPEERALCPNCSSPLKITDRYCPECGQKRLDHEDLSFSHLFRESFLDYFHFDSKLFLSLKPLVFRPGYLTREFMEGRRNRYIQPFKLFLMLSIIFFLVQSVTHHDDHEKTETDSTATADTAHNKPRLTIAGEEYPMEGQDSAKMRIEQIGLDAYVQEQYPDQSGISKYLLKKVIKINMLTGQSFGTILMHNASKMVFVLIPVFALLLKLFYMRRKRFYFEHLIFSLHYHGFFFLLLTFALLLARLYEYFFAAGILLGGVYLFFALKNFYRQSYGKTVAKLILITIAYIIIALPVFFILLGVVSILMA